MTGLVITTTTYVKYKLTPNEDIARKRIQILSQKVFAVSRCQVSYLAKFVKYINDTEEVFNRWIKSNMM